MVHFPAQARKINEIHPTKISYTSGNGNPEKTYIFSKIYISGNGKPQKTFYISGNRSPEKTSYILGSKFPNLKNQKKLLWKNSLSSRKRNFLVSGFKKKLFILQEALSKPENQTRSYSLELLTYHCLDYSLAVRPLIMHPS